MAKKTYVIAITTHGFEWLEGTSWWDSPTLEVPTTDENKKAYTAYLDGKNKQRKGV